MPTPTITVVHTAACHLCADAHEALTALGQEIAIEVELIEAGSDAGAALIDTHRPSMFPLILLDGAFFSQGRLPRGKLRAVLGSRRAVGPR